MNIFKTSAVVVAVIGVACLVFGVMFILEANNGAQKLADELQPQGLQISDVNAAYDQAKQGVAAAMQTGDTLTIVSAQLSKTSLAVAKANAGTIRFVQNSGIVAIIIGAGLTLTGAGLLRKTK